MNDTTNVAAFPSRVLVVGLGETGVAAARWCVRQGASVRVADTRIAPSGLEALRKDIDPAAIEFHLGCDVFAEGLLDEVEALVLSPGLAPGMSPVRELLDAAQSRSIKIIGEIELFARALAQLKQERAYAPKVLGITGTNGKTTVTALARHMLAAAGMKTRAAGNISPAALHALTDALDTNDLPDVWVLELSSFQLETTQTLRCTAASVLNLTQDHLDWHGTMEAYAAAKSRIFGMADTMLVNRDDERVMEMVDALAALNVRSFGRDVPMLAGDVGIEINNGVTWLCMSEPTEFDDDLPAPVKRKKNAPAPQRHPGRTVRMMPADALGIKGMHNALNCLAALSLARACGAGLAPMLRAATEYLGEPHRMEFIRTIGGVDFFNDSKGTNVGATVAGLDGLGRQFVLIAGGVGKGQDFAPLAPIIAKHARAVTLIGQDATLIAQVLSPSTVPIDFATDMQNAVACAFSHAIEGDAVVLSPACASFDMFRNYPHRGQVFADAVSELALEHGEVV